MSSTKPYNTPPQALNKVFQIRPVGRDELERFKTQLRLLLSRIDNNASDGNVMGYVADFLQHTGFGDDYLIANQDDKELVIHTGPETDSPAGIVVAVKRPDNLQDMPTPYQLNSRALHELMLYYLRERMLNGRSDIRRLIITNVYEWYIFDEPDFERLFGVNTLLAKRFRQWQAKQADSANTGQFYQEIARPYLRNLKNDTLPFTYFTLKEYQKGVNSTNSTADSTLIPLLKVLSPVHLLKRPFDTDGNTLNQAFYRELLHIIGLEERQEGDRLLIRRKHQPEAGSLLENTIARLDSEINLDLRPELATYGRDRAEQVATIALGLCLTWVSRILFLKQLEAQLASYQAGASFSFLRPDQIPDYESLDTLFFQVLASRPENRPAQVQAQFGFVPYLNSSLFEVSDLEEQTLRISRLDHSLTIPQYNSLDPALNKDKTHAPAGLSGETETVREVNTLHYLLHFLDGYSFAPAGTEEVQHESKASINASALGLILEKLNGYKDGSFFTPGFLTTYMCRETIRRAVVQRFNEALGWNCTGFEELQGRIDFDDKAVRQQADELINSLRICDPTVGTGHFLVSALHELIATKAALRVLSYRDTGERVRGYDISIENDELVIIGRETGQPFTYQLNEKGQPTPDGQRLQETLFHEKQTLIENCLFGVDINPIAVDICRQRLWIELLKHTYFNLSSEPSSAISNASAMPSDLPAAHWLPTEKLPNIDINIRRGNSLVSRFPLDAPFDKAGLERKLNDYRALVDTYKHGAEGSRKRNLREQLAYIRNELVQQLPDEAKPLRDRLRKLEVELYQRYETGTLFGSSLTAAQQKDRARIEREITDTRQKIGLIVDNPLFGNAFEWRFQFPEVLDEAGAFVGFDIVVGHLPYSQPEDSKDSKSYLAQQYHTYAATAGLSGCFIEKGICLLRPGGCFSGLTSNRFTRAGFGKPLRQWLKQWQLTELCDFGDLPILGNATTHPLILSMQKTAPAHPIRVAHVQTLAFTSLSAYLNEHAFQTGASALTDEGWTLTDPAVHILVEKIKQQGVPLGEYVQEKIYTGIKTGLNEAFVIDEDTRRQLIAKDARSAEVIKPLLTRRDIKRYQVPQSTHYLLLTRQGIAIENFPAVLSHLQHYREQLEPQPKGWRANGGTGKWPGRKNGAYQWYEILDAVDYYQELEKPKIVMPAVGPPSSYTYDSSCLYSDDKTVFIPCDDKYLLALLNSSTLSFVMCRIGSAKPGGLFDYKPASLAQLPIRKALPDVKKPFIEKAEAILAAKQQDPLADTSALEADLNRMVYTLYGLTAEEIAIIERR